LFKAILHNAYNAESCACVHLRQRNYDDPENISDWSEWPPERSLDPGSGFAQFCQNNVWLRLLRHRYCHQIQSSLNRLPESAVSTTCVPSSRWPPLLGLYVQMNVC